MLKIATFVYFSVIFTWARHRICGPVTACTGLAIENFTCFSPSVNIWARHRLHGPVADFTGPSLHFQRPRPIFMVTGPWKNDGKLFEHVIGGTLEKWKRHVFCTHKGHLFKIFLLMVYLCRDMGSPKISPNTESEKEWVRLHQKGPRPLSKYVRMKPSKLIIFQYHNFWNR